MKIYHTETQADYDALMVELENDGVTWRSGVLPTKENNWKLRPKNMCVAVSHQVAEYGSIDTYLKIYPDVPIIKYKAKAEDKMRFTKDNVLNLTDKWIENKTVSFQELQNQIKELDDTPEKVVVPKFVAEWYESQTSSRYNIQGMIENLRNGNSLEKSVINWSEEKYPKYGLRDRFDLLALMRIKGYTIAPEPLYVIPLENLVTSDGVQQYLSYDATGENYFASRPQYDLKQKYTKDELSNVPECYKIFAKPLEENQ